MTLAIVSLEASEKDDESKAKLESISSYEEAMSIGDNGPGKILDLNYELKSVCIQKFYFR